MITKKFKLEDELQKLEDYIYENGKKIDKISPEFNQIYNILYYIGFEKLKNNFIDLLEEESKKNLKMIIDLYQICENFSMTIIKQIWKIECLLTSRLQGLGLLKNNENNFGDKVSIFLKLSHEDKGILVKTINKKLSREEYQKGIIYAEIIRNKISHIDWNIFGEFEVKKSRTKNLRNEASFFLKNVIDFLDAASGKEKYFKDIFSKINNKNIKLK